MLRSDEAADLASPQMRDGMAVFGTGVLAGLALVLARTDLKHLWTPNGLSAAPFWQVSQASSLCAQLFLSSVYMTAYPADATLLCGYDARPLVFAIHARHLSCLCTLVVTIVSPLTAAVRLLVEAPTAKWLVAMHWGSLATALLLMALVGSRQYVPPYNGECDFYAGSQGRAWNTTFVLIQTALVVGTSVLVATKQSLSTPTTPTKPSAVRHHVRTFLGNMDAANASPLMATFATSIVMLAIMPSQQGERDTSGITFQRLMYHALSMLQTYACHVCLSRKLAADASQESQGIRSNFGLPIDQLRGPSHPPDLVKGRKPNSGIVVKKTSANHPSPAMPTAAAAAARHALAYTIPTSQSHAPHTAHDASSLAFTSHLSSAMLVAPQLESDAIITPSHLETPSQGPSRQPSTVSRFHSEVQSALMGLAASRPSPLSQSQSQHQSQSDRNPFDDQVTDT
ncbi:hypothetical protein BC831DRAFT_451997 [Entophlyctis helioformis]|nr:hypothetical protein BC831DRAFT_451997 [Entophlyctis helioformis]